MVTLLLPSSSSSIFKPSNFTRFQMNSQLRNSTSSPKKSNPKGKSNFNSKKRFSKYGTSRKSVIKKSFSQEQVNFDTPLPVDPTVAIIGGGISGLICALTLEERNIRSTVFDTGMHGFGGRLGTRTIDSNSQELVFDHAAQFFTADDSRFEKFVTKWLDEGLVHEWKGQLGEVDVGGQFNPLPYTTKRYIGRMGMRPLAESILQQSNRVEVVRPCWVSKLEPFNGMWHLSENGEPRGQFDSIVIAHNGKCANRLLSSSGLPLLYQQMKSLELSSIWALLAAFKDPLPIPNGSLASFEGAFVKGIDSLSWMANNTTKLSLLDSGAPHCWTFFSTAAYGKKNKVPQENIPKVTAEKVKADMLEGVEIALGLSKGSLQQPIYSRVQLWGAALPTNTPGVPCIFDPKGRAGICGDWLLGSSVEAAVISGISLGNHMADYFQSGGSRNEEFETGLHETLKKVDGHDIGQFPGLNSKNEVLQGACS